MEKQIVDKRIAAIRKRMKEEKVALYLVSSYDFHLSENPVAYFRSVEYLSGFTGAPAYIVITDEYVHLWTDGRYEIQAHRELDKTGINIHINNDLSDSIRTLSAFFRMSGDLYNERLREDIHLISEETKYIIGFDGRTIPYYVMNDIMEQMDFSFFSGNVVINPELDFIGDVWQNRPSLPQDKIIVLNSQDAGMATKSKIALVRDMMKGMALESGIIYTSLEEIAWIYNIRGMENEFDMTVLCYAFINNISAYIFIDKNKLTAKAREHFDEAGVTIKAYDEFYSFLEEDETFFYVVSASKNNAAVIITISDKQNKELLERGADLDYLRIVKNLEEREAAEEAGLKDAVSVIRFIKWITDNVGKVDITEWTAGEYIDQLRKQNGAIRPSFETICAYKENAAITHYIAEKETALKIEPDGFLLVDSGAHYQGATTDITRTIPLGPVSQEMKRNYTVTLAAMLNLQDAEIAKGVKDTQLDVIPRLEMWKNDLDYNHSTGHGVGAMLCVHESPINISWKKTTTPVAIQPGMIMSDEPGVYFKGKYGIRHENIIMCEAINDDIVGFNPLTFVPFDTSVIDTDYLSERQIKVLNDYHTLVYSKLYERLTEEEQKWLFEKTRPIKK